MRAISLHIEFWAFIPYIDNSITETVGANIARVFI